MTQVQVHLERPQEEPDEAFELHAGQITADDLLDELEDAGLENEEALEAELENERGMSAEAIGAHGMSGDGMSGDGLSAERTSAQWTSAGWTSADDSAAATVDGMDVEARLDELLLLRTYGEDVFDELESREGWRSVAHDEMAIVPRRHRGEFLCRACFLVKARTQLADSRRHLCADCL
jgi:hypothetical protein